MDGQNCANIKVWWSVQIDKENYLYVEGAKIPVRQYVSPKNPYRLTLHKNKEKNERW